MKQASYSKQFRKDYKKISKRNKNDIILVQNIISSLMMDKILEEKYKDHQLKGKWADCRECHVKPDLLLIYSPTQNKVYFERIGSHSELFS